MANLELKREFCVFLESKSLTEKLAHFKSPLSLCARRCGAFKTNSEIKLQFFSNPKY